jgi:hypothetical protein
MYAIMAVCGRNLPFWQTIVLPLRKGGYFLTVSGDCFILTSQSLYPLTTTRFTYFNNHKIITPLVAGISLFSFYNTRTTQSLAIELQNFLATDWPVDSIGQTRLVTNSDSQKTHTGLTLGIFDDLELGSHCFSFFEVYNIDSDLSTVSTMTAKLVVFFLFLLTLATSDRRTIPLVIGIDSSIVAIIATVEADFAVFLAPRANITHHNPNIAAIAKHLSFSLSLLPLYRHYTVPYLNVKEKKSWKKYFFVAQYLL